MTECLQCVDVSGCGRIDLFRLSFTQSKQWVTGSDPRPTDPHKK